jgi:hypothetical protein
MAWPHQRIAALLRPATLATPLAQLPSLGDWDQVVLSFALDCDGHHALIVCHSPQ